MGDTLAGIGEFHCTTFCAVDANMAEAKTIQ